VITGLAMIELRVRDWPATLRFYQEGLGLSGKIREERGWAEFTFPNSGAVLALRRETEAGDGPKVDIDLLVPDLAAALAELQSRGITPIGAPIEGKGYRMALLRDPEGNIVQLFERA
jgi:predicted enzyme related to lactoylglutathione lyase